MCGLYFGSLFNMLVKIFITQSEKKKGIPHWLSSLENSQSSEPKTWCAFSFVEHEIVLLFPIWRFSFFNKLSSGKSKIWSRSKTKKSRSFASVSRWKKLFSGLKLSTYKKKSICLFFSLECSFNICKDFQLMGVRMCVLLVNTKKIFFSPHCYPFNLESR